MGKGKIKGRNKKEIKGKKRGKGKQKRRGREKRKKGGRKPINGKIKRKKGGLQQGEPSPCPGHCPAGLEFPALGLGQEFGNSSLPGWVSPVAGQGRLRFPLGKVFVLEKVLFLQN